MSKIYNLDQLTDSVELLEKTPSFYYLVTRSSFLTLLGFIIWAYVGKVDIVSKGTAIVQGNLI